MAEHTARRHTGTALVHVEIGAADVGAGDLHQYVGAALDPRAGHLINRNTARPVVNECFHFLASFAGVAATLFFSCCWTLPKLERQTAQVDRGITGLEEDLLALLQNMLVDKLAELLDVRVIPGAIRLHGLNPPDHCLSFCVFQQRSIHQGVVVGRFFHAVPRWLRAVATVGNPRFPAG